MRHLPACTLCACLLLITLSSTQAEAQQLLPGDHARGSWYIGFGLGSGNGTLKFNGLDDFKLSDLGGDVADPLLLNINFKVGATINDTLLVGLDVNGLRSQADAEVTSGGNTTTVSQAIQLNSYNAVLTWFPLREGVFVRGGLGLSAVIAELSIGNTTATNDATGFGGQIGGGFAVWLLDSFNMSINLDYHYHSYGGDDGEPESANFWNAYLGFDWF